MKKEYKVIEHTTSLIAESKYKGYMIGVNNIKWHRSKDDCYWEGDIVLLACKETEPDKFTEIYMALAEHDIEYRQYISKDDEDPEGWR